MKAYKVITETGAVHDSTCGFAKGATKRTNKPYTCQRCAKRNGQAVEKVEVPKQKKPLKVAASKGDKRKGLNMTREGMRSIPKRGTPKEIASTGTAPMRDLLKAAQDLLIATGFLVASGEGENGEALDLINSAVRTIADAKALI